MFDSSGQMLQMLTGYGNNEEVTRLLDKFDWYFLPVMNPDGYDYSWTNVSKHKKWVCSEKPNSISVMVTCIHGCGAGLV